jgi:hypothetical protein
MSRYSKVSAEYAMGVVELFSMSKMVGWSK